MAPRSGRIERRLGEQQASKSSALPHDYLEMVREVFTTNFDSGLKALAEISAAPYFEAGGEIFTDEVILYVSLLHKDQLAATTVYASSDFDPQASAPTVQEVLSACVDAIGAVFGQILDSSSPAGRKRLEAVAQESLSALENIPFQWTPLEVDRQRIHVKVDKANPQLDQLADDWLAKNDPDELGRRKKEHADTEALFVTGPKKKPGDPSTH